MKVARLKLANVRAIKAAKFRFQPGFNLIVGANGAGKTTVLDALAVCLSDVVRRANKLPGRFGIPFRSDDIRIGADNLDVCCVIEGGVQGAQYNYAIRKSRESTVPQAKRTSESREQMHGTPDKAEFIGEAPPIATGIEPEGRPLAVLFSTNRAVPSDKAPTRDAAAGGVTAAFRGALSSRRELHLGEFATWIRAQEAAKPEWPAARHVTGAMEDALTRFLPGFRNLRVAGAGASVGSLLIDRNDGTTLLTRSLSDGERGVLAMVLDLTRRLVQANPTMEDPAAEAEAIVLIDKIELHLHPTSQRRIVANLTRTFPRCQFIVTTHSPQVIGEVKHDRIQIIDADQVYSPTHSFGVDSNRVLEEIMEADPRTEDVKALLSKISRMIRNDEYENVDALLAELSGQLGENDPEVTHIRTLMDFMTSEA